MKEPLDPWIEGYLDYQLKVRRLSPRSIIDMRCTLKRAVQTLGAVRPSVPLWKLTLQDYLHWVNSQREAGYSTQSLNKDLSHLRGLLDYTWRSGRSDRNVLDGLTLEDRHRRQVPRFLTLEQARQLIEACPGATRAQRRDRLMILLLYGCGLRTSELCQLDLADVDLERQELVVRQGKGERSRRLPVPEAVWTVLRNFYRAIVAMGHLEPAQNPMAHFPKIKAAPRKLPTTLSREEVGRLLDQPSADTVLGLRDRAVLTLLYGTGIRASECAGLAEKDIDWQERTIRVRGKGGQERSVPLNDEVLHVLRQYRLARGGVKAGEPFFRGRVSPRKVTLWGLTAVGGPG